MAINPNLLRLFSNGESFLDNDGKPLVGNVAFYDRDNPGRTCRIYDKNGTTIQNPMPTTSTGRLEQDVYLENNKAYLIEFAKYIPELSAYLFQYSVELPKNIFVFQYDDELSNSVVTYFDNVDQMTNEIGPFVDGKIYGLKGYYTAGDKDIVYYRCEAYTGENDGGSTFTVNSAEDEQQHTLRIIPPTEKYFDVRHFGIFPSNSEYINLSQLQNCDNYCYTNGYIMSFVPSGAYAIYFIQNANLNLLSTIFGTSQTVIDFTNSTSALKLDDCLIKINASAGCNITLNGTTIHQSNIGAGAESYITPIPTINYIVDQYSASTISAKDVNFIILANTTDNVYNIENCKIYSNAKINLAKRNTIKYCYIRQSFFYNLTEANIKQQTLLGNTTNKGDWFTSYYWLAFLIVGKQQEIDLQGSVGLGGYSLDIDKDTVIKNGTISNGTITFAQGLFTMENVTCTSSALIKTYTTVKTTSNNYNAILTGCTFETGNKSQFICKTLKATNCDFMSAGSGTPYGFNIDCEYVNAVNCNFYCDVFACSYIAGTKYESYFSNNNFHSNLYIRPGTSTSSAYISADWGLSYQMWNYGCTIMNNNFYEAADSAGHIRIYQITWDNQTVPNQTGYICKLLQINNNNIISNLSQTPISVDKVWNWIQYPERPTPGNPATGVLYRYTGEYSYKNNQGDFSFKYKILRCKTRKYVEGIQYNSGEIVCQKDGGYCYCWLYNYPLSKFIFTFDEEKSKRKFDLKITIQSQYIYNANISTGMYILDNRYYFDVSGTTKEYNWYHENQTSGNTVLMRGIRDDAYVTYTDPQSRYYNVYLKDLPCSRKNLCFVSYTINDGYPRTADVYTNDNDHYIIVTVEEL